jgi:hypothetical protein
MRKNVLEHPEDALWYRVACFFENEGTPLACWGFMCAVNKTWNLLQYLSRHRGKEYAQEQSSALQLGVWSAEGYFITYWRMKE